MGLPVVSPTVTGRRVWSNESETDIELWPCQPIETWPLQARDASERTFTELKRLSMLCEVLVRAPRPRAPGTSESEQSDAGSPTDGWYQTNAVLVARFKPGNGVLWVELMNYHAFLPVEEAAMVGHPEDVMNVLKDEDMQGMCK